MMEHVLNENDRARLYFLQEKMKDRIDVENSSEDFRLVATTVMEICRILSRMEKHQ
jgi:hypothetical protein